VNVPRAPPTLYLVSTMAIRFLPSDPFSSLTDPANHKALLVGINYSSTSDHDEDRDRPSPLVGPVNDVKEMKKMLMGAVQLFNNSPTALSFLIRSMVDNTEIYGYHEDDILVMTDEEGNRGSKLWPSKGNIVSFLLTGYSRRYPSTDLQLQAMDDLVYKSSSQDAFVFFCEPSFVPIAFAC
jgi:hypothetical protein